MPGRTQSRVLAGTGLVLLLVGAGLSAAGTMPVSARAAILGAGAGFVLLATARHARSLLLVMRGQSARRGADSLLAVMLLTAILVVIQATSMRHSRQFDLTRNRRHTLAPQTLQLLATLDRDVLATAFVRQNSATRAGAAELLDLYARRSPRFRYRLVDPDRQPDLAARLAAAPDEIVLEAGDRRFVARPPGEESVTSALIHVTRSEPGAIYFISGHGEKSLTGEAREGYSVLTRHLESQGYGPRPLSLINAGAVPADASVVVVAGPRRDYFEAEIDALRSYARAGGSILFLIDPRTEVPNIGGLLSDYGLSVLNAVVLDEKELRAGDRTFDATVVKVRRYERHVITRGFNYVTMYPRARPVLLATDSTTVGVSAQYLGFTDDASWGETDMERFAGGTASRDGVDIAGPLPISAVSVRSPMGQSSQRKSRVVLVGDSDFASNLFIDVLGNADLLQNAIAFLAGDDDMISIRPREGLGDHVYLSARQGRMVFIVCIVLLPAIGIVTGGVVIARRRAL